MIDSVTESAGAAPDLKKARRRKAGFSEAAPGTDRLPPHSPEAEQGVLGCVLLSPNDCVGECVEKFKAGAEVFYDLRHRAIFETLVEMYDQREAIDIITLQQRLKNKQRLDEVGGHFLPRFTAGYRSLRCKSVLLHGNCAGEVHPAQNDSDLHRGGGPRV